MTWYHSTTAAITGVGFSCCVSFVVWYATQSKMAWVKSEHGCFLMYVAFALGSLFGFICFNQLRPRWTGQLVVAIVIFSLLLGITFWLPRILWVSIRLAEKEAQQAREKSK